VRQLYRALDFSQVGLRREDLAFLKEWIPPVWLTASPDKSTLRGYKEHLSTFYGSSLQAWKKMDADGSNRLSWQEFLRAAISSKFPAYEELPVIWRTLDLHFRGYIARC